MTPARQPMRLEDALSVLIDYRGKSPPKSTTGTPVISAKVVKGGRILRPIEQTIDPDYYPKWMTRGYPKSGDVILTTEGPLGEIAQLDDETANFAVAQRVVVLRGKPGILDNTFLKFLLISPAQQAILSSFATGTTVEGISQKSLRSLPIKLPPYPEQRAIAEALGALDAKLELNRCTNETLEATAKAIFKDWFVNFGPTCAKIEGRANYLAPEYCSLFPSSLDEDGKPRGWRAFRLQELAVHHTRGIMPLSTPQTEFEHFSLPAYDAGQSPAIDQGSKIKSNKTLMPTNAILLSKLNPEIERVWIPENRLKRQQICSTEFLVFTPTDISSRSLLFGLFTSPEFRAVLHSMVTGTSNSHQRISPPTLLQRAVLVGSDAAFSHYSSIATVLLEKVLANRTESRAIAETRDFLLPRLMSGEIRVKDAEELVAEAT